MDGATLRAGAVAGVQRVQPDRLARAVMERSKHVMLTARARKPSRRRSAWPWSNPTISAPKALAAVAEGVAKDPKGRRTPTSRRSSISAPGCGGAGPQRSSRPALHRRHDQQALRPRRRCADHRAGTYANAGCAVSGTAGAILHPHRSRARHLRAVNYLKQPIADAAETVINGDIPNSWRWRRDRAGGRRPAWRCHSTPRACIAAGSRGRRATRGDLEGRSNGSPAAR